MTGDTMSAKWSTEQIPDQHGRTAIVTGANSGLGLVSARELARHGASVVLACRNTAKGESALREIEAAVPDARVEVSELDLGSLESVRSFAERYRSTHDGLDLLINNAGLMAPPRGETADGFELQLGTNHLGHFALTGRLIGAMEGRADARVVCLSSIAHRTGRIKFDDLQSERRYSRWRAYGQSKLADLMSALELDRRLRAARLDGQERGRPPGLLRHQPAERRAAALGSDGHESDQRDRRPVRGGGRAADALCRHLSGPAGRQLRRAGRARRVPWPPAHQHPQPRRPRRGRGRATVGRLRRADWCALRPGRPRARVRGWGTRRMRRVRQGRMRPCPEAAHVRPRRTAHAPFVAKPHAAWLGTAHVRSRSIPYLRLAWCSTTLPNAASSWVVMRCLNSASSASEASPRSEPTPSISSSQRSSG